MIPDSAPDSASQDPGAFVSGRAGLPKHTRLPLPLPFPVLVLLLAAPYLALAFVGATEANVPQTLGCLGAAFAIYWFGCVENHFGLSEGRILALGLLLRLLILPMPPSDDMYRFLWEGKILGYGFNPFLMAPDDPALAPLRDGYWPLINHPNLPTLYPPVAQALFWLLAKLGGSPWVLKLGFLAFDVGAFLVLRGIVRGRIRPKDPGARAPIANLPEGALTPAAGTRVLALYFLNPLLIFEIAGRGHFDSMPVFFNVLFLAALSGREGTRKEARNNWAPVALGLGAMAKISSLALAPLLLFSLGWKRAMAWGAALAALVGGSLWAVGAFTVLGKFASKYRFNAAIPSLLDSALPFVSADARRNLSMALFGLACLACLRWFRRDPPERQAIWFMGMLLLFSPTMHPWYLLWLLPFMALCQSRPWILLTGTVLITYEVYGRAHVTGHWHENPWLRLPEYLPPLALWLYLRRRRKRGERGGRGKKAAAMTANPGAPS